ncbi:hypothetical protein DIPPA_20586 [Diplonema papillatum]|nr:hypothetical protein DIPPA_29767 [Diplonema papillatum]KAJ9459935.1 hypothetical protein DIPPA_22714 [Diplonema papillatum]KAJ9462847.1 hypothetical protein DIPPA_20586 [Diplonema papillatum]
MAAPQSPFRHSGTSNGWTTFAFPASYRGDLEKEYGEIPDASRRLKVSDLESRVAPWFAGIPQGEQLAAARRLVAELLRVDVGGELLELAPWKVAAMLLELEELDKAKFEGVVSRGAWRGVPPLTGAAAAQPVPPPALPDAPQQQWQQLFERQMRAQQQQQAQMMLMLQQMQAEVQSLRSASPVPPAAASDGRPSAAPAAETAAAVAPRAYPKEAKDVLALADAIHSDPDGLIRDLEAAYVCGRAHLAGGELLETNFDMFRSWVQAMSTTVGWAQSPDHLRLGNDLLAAVRIQRLYVEKGHSRRDILRQVGEQATDPIDRAEAVLDARKERGVGKKPMHFKPRSGNARAGGK